MAITISRQWMMGTTAISGATGTTLTLTSDMVDQDITCRVTATNEAGSITVASNSIGPVLEPAVPDSVYEGLGANTVWGNERLTATNWQEFGMSVLTATSDMSRVKLALTQMGKSPNTLLIPDAGGEYLGIGIEYPIVSGRRNTSGHNVQRLTFGGLNASGVQGRTDTTFTDWLTLSTPIPKGAQFRVWTHYRTSTSDGHGMCRNNARTDTNDGDWFILQPGSLGDPIGTSTVPDFNASGTNAKPCKVLAVITETVEPSIIAVGDSMFMFSSLLGAQNNYDRHGAFKQIPMVVAFLNLGISSLTVTGASAWRNWSGLWKMLPYCSTFINQLGFNDQAAVNDAATKTEQNYIASLATAAENKYICTITPTVTYSAAHKGWTQETGQVSSAAWTQRNAYNENVRGARVGLENYTGYLDMAEGFCTTPTSGIFKVSPVARQVTPVSYVVNTTSLSVPGAAFTAADVGYGWSCAATAGGGVTLSAYISAVTDTESATSGQNAGSSTSTGDFNIGAYVTDGVHPTQKLWDVAIPIVGLDNPDTWVRVV